MWFWEGVVLYRLAILNVEEKNDCTSLGCMVRHRVRYCLDKCNSSMASIHLVQHIWYVLHAEKLKHVAHTFLLDESDLQDWTNQLRDEVGPLAIQAAPHLKHGLGH